MVHHPHKYTHIYRANGPLGSSKDYKNTTQRAMLLGTCVMGCSRTWGQWKRSIRTPTPFGNAFDRKADLGPEPEPDFLELERRLGAWRRMNGM